MTDRVVVVVVLLLLLKILSATLPWFTFLIPNALDTSNSKFSLLA